MEGIRVTAHPLDTPLILDCIFKSLGVPDLKMCRQVNRVWHEEATKCMRPAVTVKFGSKLELESEDRRPDFLELVQSELSTFSMLPFVSDYELQRVNADHPEFWASCGSSVKTLQLSHIKFESADIFRHVIFQSCPNLEDLILSEVKVDGSVDEDNAEDDEEEPLVWVEPQFPQNMNLYRLVMRSIELGDISFLEVFSYFPSLEEIHIYVTQDSSRALKALATCREHDPQSWNIKNISFDIDDVKEPESDLQFFSDQNLSLETLNVWQVHETEHASVVRNILSGHATTLKSLNLYGEKAAEVFDSPYETMLEKVVDFTLDLTQIALPRFLRYLPNLKKLKLSFCTFCLEPESKEEFLNHWIVSSCTDFTLILTELQGRRGWEENLFLLFTKIPNVEKIKVQHCTNELFTGICEFLPNLVSLKLEYSEVDDCGISGLDEEYVERINEPSGLKMHAPVSKPRPNLSNLKNLKWFHYEALRHKPITLGFCAAQYGVLRLPQLQHLKVIRCEDTIWDRLHKQFPWRDP